MARDPTTFSKVSTGYKDSANTIGEANYDHGYIDGYGEELTLATSLTAPDVTASDDVVATSDVSAGGNVYADGGLIVGGGSELIAISTGTEALDFGSVAVDGYSTVTMGLSGATRGDSLFITPDSKWSGAYYELIVHAQSSETAGEIHITAANSGKTATDPDAIVFRATRINWGSYI